MPPADPGPLHRIQLPGNPYIRSAAFSPDGETLYVLINDQAINLWELLLHFWPEFGGGLTALAAIIFLIALRRIVRTPAPPRPAPLPPLQLLPQRRLLRPLPRMRQFARTPDRRPHHAPPLAPIRIAIRRARHLLRTSLGVLAPAHRLGESMAQLVVLRHRSRGRGRRRRPPSPNGIAPLTVVLEIDVLSRCCRPHPGDV